MSDTIKEKLSKIKEFNKDVYDILIHDKLEFDSLTRFKKIIKQSLRKCKVGGLKVVFNNTSPKQIINRINTPSHKKKILYITITPSLNLLRQSISIRKKGDHETIILMENPWLYNLMEKHFDVVYIYNTYYELANIILEAKPYIIHVQGTMLGADFLCILAKLLNGRKIVFEFFDVSSFCVTKEDSITLWGEKSTELGFFAEQYACENADGIILGYSPEAANILKDRYNIKSPILEFHAYASSEFIPKENRTKYSSEDGRLHFVYGGNVAASNLPKNFLGDNRFHKLIEALTSQGICYDIFTTPHISSLKFDQFFSEYIAIAKKNNLFRFMRGLHPYEAANEFSRYDFGMMIYLFNLGTFLKPQNDTRLQGKFFLYLEAGLPILISEEFEFISKLVREYEIGIVVKQEDIYNLSKIIPTYDYDKLRENVLVARRELSMDAHIHTLLKFYEDCAG